MLSDFLCILLLRQMHQVHSSSVAQPLFQAMSEPFLQVSTPSLERNLIKEAEKDRENKYVTSCDLVRVYHPQRHSRTPNTSTLLRSVGSERDQIQLSKKVIMSFHLNMNY